MESQNHESLATADHVAKTLEGDCTEYAMLTAAMCRAEGVPSRTAMGLVYADIKNAPALRLPHVDGGISSMAAGCRWMPRWAGAGWGRRI